MPPLRRPAAKPSRPSPASGGSADEPSPNRRQRPLDSDATSASAPSATSTAASSSTGTTTARSSNASTPSLPGVLVVPSLATSVAASSTRATSDAENRPGVKHKRTLRACERCRMRKQRCDSDHPPCPSCLKGGHECIYSGGSGIDPKRLEDLERNNVKLREENEALKRENEGLRGARTDEGAAHPRDNALPPAILSSNQVSGMLSSIPVAPVSPSELCSGAASRLSIDELLTRFDRSRAQGRGITSTIIDIPAVAEPGLAGADLDGTLYGTSHRVAASAAQEAALLRRAVGYLACRTPFLPNLSVIESWHRHFHSRALQPAVGGQQRPASESHRAEEVVPAADLDVWHEIILACLCFLGAVLDRCASPERVEYAKRLVREASSKSHSITIPLHSVENIRLKLLLASIARVCGDVVELFELSGLAMDLATLAGHAWACLQKAPQPWPYDVFAELPIATPKRNPDAIGSDPETSAETTAVLGYQIRRLQADATRLQTGEAQDVRAVAERLDGWHHCLEDADEKSRLAQAHNPSLASAVLALRIEGQSCWSKVLMAGHAAVPDLAARLLRISVVIVDLCVQLMERTPASELDVLNVLQAFEAFVSILIWQEHVDINDSDRSAVRDRLDMGCRLLEDLGHLLPLYAGLAPVLGAAMAMASWYARATSNDAAQNWSRRNARATSNDAAQNWSRRNARDHVPTASSTIVTGRVDHLVFAVEGDHLRGPMPATAASSPGPYVPPVNHGGWPPRQGWVDHPELSAEGPPLAMPLPLQEPASIMNASGPITAASTAVATPADGPFVTATTMPGYSSSTTNTGHLPVGPVDAWYRQQTVSSHSGLRQTAGSVAGWDTSMAGATCLNNTMPPSASKAHQVSFFTGMPEAADAAYAVHAQPVGFVTDRISGYPLGAGGGPSSLDQALRLDAPPSRMAPSPSSVAGPSKRSRASYGYDNGLA
ncbi:uncharacterized protein PSFLO_05188 [Pseudozyma flocculosa]|uniref:Zn(2)-C6 fungal-type domain-containing protein n=1 Tax=Pseudozyma flocculosa TaxID=84751 RepID=A0A5C3F7M2_9BASI|nr:uncharacterized protein PSFLO_05188 [Pseudozyma flocculosa]